MKVESALLNIAWEDLKAAKLLFRKKLYPQSIFFFEQAIEKAIKFIGVKEGTITKKGEIISKGEKRKIWHKVLPYHLLILGAIRDVFEASPEGQGTDTMHSVKLLVEEELGKPAVRSVVAWTKRTQKYLKEYCDDDNKAFRISFSEKRLSKFLSECREVEDELDDYERRISRIRTKDVTEDVVTGFRKFCIDQVKIGLRFIGLHPELGVVGIAQVDIKRMEEDIQQQITPKSIVAMLRTSASQLELFYYRFVVLSNLAILLCPHVSKSRYEYDDFNPLIVYNNELPLIRMLDQFISLAEEMLKRLYRIYEVLTPIPLDQKGERVEEPSTQ